MRKKHYFLVTLMTLLLSISMFTNCSDDDDEAESENNDFSATNDLSYILDDAEMLSDEEYENTTDDDFVVEEEPLGAAFIEKEGEEVEDASLEEEEIFGASRIDKYNYSYNEIELDDEENSNGYNHYGNFTYTVTKQSTRFKIVLEKSGGFKKAGTAYLKMGHIAGEIIEQKTYRAGQTSIVMYITPKWDYGAINVFPMVISRDGTRSYSNPILIYTDQMYDDYWKFNHELGRYNGVEVLCNNSRTNCGDGKNQCVDYVKRYARDMYGLKYQSYGAYARLWWTNSSIKKLFYRNSNGGSTAPCVGDIIVFKGGDYGHIGVIMEVGEDYIKIVHQNGGTDSRYAPIGAKLTLKRSGGRYTIGNMYGGARVPLGWLHHKTRY